MHQKTHIENARLPELRAARPNAPKAVTVILADDHPLIRQGLRYCFTESGLIEVVAEAGDGPQAVRLIKKYKPDVAVLDVNMPSLSGLEVACWAREHQSATRILILTAYDDSQHVRLAVESGVSGYLLKDTDPDRIVDAVVALSQGEVVFDPALVEYRQSPVETEHAVDTAQMSKRELQILDQLVRGHTDKVIGQNLGISSLTVGTHMARIFKKLGVTSRTQAITRAMALGFVDVPPPA